MERAHCRVTLSVRIWGRMILAEVWRKGGACCGQDTEGRAALVLGDMGLLKQVRSMMKYFKGHAVLLLLSTDTSWRQANK